MAPPFFFWGGGGHNKHEAQDNSVLKEIQVHLLGKFRILEGSKIRFSVSPFLFLCSCSGFTPVNKIQDHIMHKEVDILAEVAEENSAAVAAFVTESHELVADFVAQYSWSHP